MSTSKTTASRSVQLALFLGILVAVPGSAHQSNAAYWCLHMEADINGNSCMDLAGAYNPPDSGFAYKQLNIVPRKPSFYK